MAAKVIIVDDDRDTREMLQVALEVEGYEVMLAANGLRLISSLHVDQPDLILLDVMMSWIDGFELCRSVKKNAEFSHIPVIFISGKKMPEDIRLGLEVGAVAYFTKPIDLEALIEKIVELVGPGDAHAALDGAGDDWDDELDDEASLP
jgi:DNA-binding response OmpR family regulator